MGNIIKERSRLVSALTEAWPQSWKTTLWLLRLMVPISLAVGLLQFYGGIEWMAQWLDPLFVSIGLPGYSAIAFLTGAFVTTYAGIAVMLSMVLTLREATIISVMICICHALFVESAVVKRTGSSFWKMWVLRFVLAFVCGYYLNAVLPEMSQVFMAKDSVLPDTLTVLLTEWCLSTLRMAVVILAFVYVLMVVQRLLDSYGLIHRMSHFLSPMMKVFGLPCNSAYMWVVGNVLGISYGSAVMLDLEERGMITREEANDVNYHLVMNHSMLEDTCVFASFGVSAFWILSTRILFALVVVWGRRFLKGVMRLCT